MDSSNAEEQKSRLGINGLSDIRMQTADIHITLSLIQSSDNLVFVIFIFYLFLFKYKKISCFSYHIQSQNPVKLIV